MVHLRVVVETFNDGSSMVNIKAMSRRVVDNFEKRKLNRAF